MTTLVNVGCGMSPIKGWANFDNSLSVRIKANRLLCRLLLTAAQRNFAHVAREAGIQWANATALPLPDCSTDVLYSSHMLEHLTREAAALFLQEAHRVLKVGGIIRLSVPDLRVLAEEYLSTGDANCFVDRTLLAVNANGFKSRLRLFLAGNREHNWMYDGASLCELLQSHNFSSPHVLPPGETLITKAEGLDLRERAEESVYVEAIKPPLH